MIKKVDERIRTLIRNGVETRHRSMFVIIGDKFRDQIVNLYYLLLSEQVSKNEKPVSNSKQVSKNKKRVSNNVLWCYRDKLELSSHKIKQAKQMKALKREGVIDPEKVATFSLFLENAGITFCRYKDSERILGSTYGMCILQDFEALTPNLLARTIETVDGGGLVILLIRSLSSLTSLYTMVMDVHERFRTESHSGSVTGRFNERFLLSLASCRSCIVMDDELNILPISSHMKSLAPVLGQKGQSRAEYDLDDLKKQLKDDFPVGPLIEGCFTFDQGKAVMKFLDAILDKRLSSTVALLAGRGRGKSAALGLAIAGAVAAGHSNIFVTAPSPENLKTLFEFVSKGFDMLDYKKHLDYDIVESSSPDLKKVTIRINIYKRHRQTIQYIKPHEHGKLSQVELLVIDEAAAIPPPVVKSLLGPYLVFLSSTVNGYEGTGRSLSLKLVQQLEEQSQASTKSTNAVPCGCAQAFKKIELSEAIRYAPDDQIESWLNNLLCLDVANSIPRINRLPPLGECDLYYVNRDTLFSYHRDSELFLQRMMALYVASHYKNSPNDLQLLADAPAHHLFVLLGPVSESRNHLPDILCVIQVCLEGNISKASVMRSLSSGHMPSGDQIPWTFCKQFQDEDFPSLSGARIVRIATHPDAMKLGYGSAAIELLARYFQSQIRPISEVDVQNVPDAPHLKITEAAEKVSLLEENIKPRSDLPPLLVHLGERRPEKLHYLGVSFGLTLDLFRFWRKQKFTPFYICEDRNSVTGEHTCMMLKPLDTDDIQVNGSNEFGFISPFYQRAFKAKFAILLCSPKFNTMDYKLAMSILDPKINFKDVEPSSTISYGSFDDIFKCPKTIKKIEAYVNCPGDHDLISGFKHPLAYLYFQEKLPVTLSYSQASVLLCMGLQNQDASYAEVMMKLDRFQIWSLFKQVIKKFLKYLKSKQFTPTLPLVNRVYLRPHPISVDEDLDEAAKKVKDELKAKSEDLLNLDLLERYAISDDKDVDFESALQKAGGNLPPIRVVSVKSSKTKVEKHEKSKEKSDKKRSIDRSSSKSSKKKKRTS